MWTHTANDGLGASKHVNRNDFERIAKIGILNFSKSTHYELNMCEIGKNEY